MGRTVVHKKRGRPLLHAKRFTRGEQRAFDQKVGMMAPIKKVIDRLNSLEDLAQNSSDRGDPKKSVDTYWQAAQDFKSDFLSAYGKISRALSKVSETSNDLLVKDAKKTKNSVSSIELRCLTLSKLRKAKSLKSGDKCAELLLDVLRSLPNSSEHADAIVRDPQAVKARMVFTKPYDKKDEEILRNASKTADEKALIDHFMNALKAVKTERGTHKYDRCTAFIADEFGVSASRIEKESARFKAEHSGLLKELGLISRR